MPGGAARITTATGTPAFTSGPEGTVTMWTRAAERMLHIPAADAIGRKCHDVLAGRDVFGNAYCLEECPIRVMVRRHQDVRPFRLDVSDESGTTLALRVSIVVFGGSGAEPSLMHVIEPITEGPIPHIDEEPDQRVTPPSRVRLDYLTRREVEVLSLIGAGVGTHETAARLGISRATVRNHVQSCLRKLEAHTRLEAVRAAERLGLLCEGPPDLTAPVAPRWGRQGSG